MEFVRRPECRDCELWETCKSVCVPTTPVPERLGTWSGMPIKPKHDRALLFVGEAPGHREDEVGEPFQGKSGIYLRRIYIDWYKFRDEVDVYAGNAVRCRIPGNDSPTRTQLKSCHGHLLHDVKVLQQHYGEVIVVACGGTAVQAVLGPKVSLTKALLRQGQPTDWRGLFPDLEAKTKLQKAVVAKLQEQAGENPYPEPCVVFSTFHPAFVVRENSRGYAVKSHLRLLQDYLHGVVGNEIEAEKLEIEISPIVTREPLWRASLDIETYGILKGRKQTMFHPVRSEEFDGIARDKMVVTVGLTWQSDRESGPRHAIFVMSQKAHRRRLWGWLQRMQRDPRFECLVNQNICFDILYLRYCYPECRSLLDHPLPIADLMVQNYLHDEGRPERSLKALAPLFRITEYEAAKGFVQYENENDGNLWAYNCQDTASTLRLYEVLEHEIKEFYGPNTPKVGAFCRQWYSQLLWLIVWMSETGIAMDAGQLELALSRMEKLRTGLSARCKEQFGYPLKGKGSETGKRKAVNAAVEWLETHGKVPPLERTDKKGEISFGAENRNALLGVLPLDTHEARWLTLMGRYQDASKVLDSYLYPLLVGRGKNHDNPDSKLIDGVAYPKWFPVPSQWEDDTSGGTKQARIVAVGPPVQTFPRRVKRAIRSRQDCLVWVDYSQIELRVAALLSNDPVMMEEYRGQPDLHGKTAKLIFGDDIVNHPKYKSLYRQAGKTLNFLVLYLGGPDKFHETLMRDVGLDYPLEKCMEAIKAFRRRHDRLTTWQYEMLTFATKHGYFELPLIGQSRIFAGGKAGVRKMSNEIVNLPVQAIAADIMLSGQFALWEGLRKVKSTAVVPINVYDAVAIECRRLDLPRVQGIMDRVLPCPPFAEALFDHLGRDIPLEYEVTVK